MTWYALFLRVVHRDCAIRGVQFDEGRVRIKVGNETCIGETDIQIDK